MQELAKNTYYLGTFGTPPIISLYLLRGKTATLIEAGPASISQEVLQALRANGIPFADIRHIVLTHVHIDHAGGAWRLLEHLPKARVYVYEPGAKHVVDPSRLVASAAGIIGELSQAWGEMKPVAEDRVVRVRDADALELGEHRLRVIATTGHAAHHVSLFEEDTRTMFTGDAVGLYYQEFGALWPASPPPSFDLPLALHDLETLASHEPDYILMPHFGPAKDRAIFDRNRETYLAWHRFITTKMKETEDPDRLVSALAEAFPAYRRLLRDPYARRSFWIDVVGFLNYLRKRQAS